MEMKAKGKLSARPKGRGLGARTVETKAMPVGYGRLKGKLAFKTARGIDLTQPIYEQTMKKDKAGPRRG
jgi:hypothetical protein